MTAPWPLPVVALGSCRAATALWNIGQAPHATIVVKSTFSLQNDGEMVISNPREIVVSDRHRDLLAPSSLVESTELAPFLPVTSVTLHGHAYAPFARAVPEMNVRLLVYRDRPLIDKVARVVGSRVHAAAKPHLFDRMPLVYERALGGPFHDENPVGVGADDVEAPNVLHPTDPRLPAGFGPLSPHWRARERFARADPREGDLRGLLAPNAELPPNVDWRFYVAAPADQQTTFLAGDEWVVLEGMHPGFVRIQSRLPRARALAMWQLHGAAPHPVDLFADTMVIDADALVCTVCWRGHFALPAADAAARIQVFAGVELPNLPISWPSSAAKPAVSPSTLPFAPTFGLPYDGVIDPAWLRPTASMEADEHSTGRIQAGAPAAPVLPFRPGPAVFPIGAPGAEDDAPPPGSTLAVLTPHLPVMPFRQGAAPAPPVSSGMQRPPETVGAPSVPAPPASAPGAMPSAPGAVSGPPPAVSAIAQGFGPSVSASSKPPPQTLGMMLAGRGGPGAPAGMMPSYLSSKPPPIASPDEPLASGLPTSGEGPVAKPELLNAPAEVAAPAETGKRAEILAKHKAGEPLDGMDLNGLDLSNLDLTGASMIGTKLTKANLTRAKLEGAKLAKAVLVEATLKDAKLARADLAGADLSRAVLDRADLTEASLTDAKLTSASLREADLTSVGAARVSLAQAQLVQAVLRHATLTNADLTGANLTGAVLAGATLEDANLVNATGEDMDCTGATFARVRADGAKFQRSSFTKLEGTSVVLERAILRECQFVGASLKSANLTRASCEGADFTDADMTQARLRQAELGKAVFTNARMEDVKLQRVTGDGAIFKGANLDGADLRQAILPNSNFNDVKLRKSWADGADLTNAQFARADLSRCSLRGASLTGSILTDAKLDAADLREANLERARMSGATTKGAKMTGANTAGAITE